jgi:hypothetical protein
VRSPCATIALSGARDVLCTRVTCQLLLSTYLNTCVLSLFLGAVTYGMSFKIWVVQGKKETRSCTAVWSEAVVYLNQYAVLVWDLLCEILSAVLQICIIGLTLLLGHQQLCSSMVDCDVLNS